MLGLGVPGRIAALIAVWNSTTFATSYLLSPGGRRKTVPLAPRLQPVWRPDRSLRLARMAGMQVRADGVGFVVRGCFVASRMPWRSIERFEVRRGLLPEGLHVVLRDGTDRRISVLDPGIGPSHVDARGRRVMAARLNAILESSAPRGGERPPVPPNP